MKASSESGLCAMLIFWRAAAVLVAFMSRLFLGRAVQ
jgi:hypothetical protein